MVLKKVEEILGKTDGIDSFTTIGGYGVVTNTYQSNYGTVFARLNPWEERHGEALKVKGIMATLQRQFAHIPEAIIFPFNIPTLAGFGASSGFNFLIQDRSGTLSVRELGDQTRKFLATARAAARTREPLHLVRPELSSGQGRPGSREGAHVGCSGE